MSQFTFSPALLSALPATRSGGSLRTAYSNWLLTNHGQAYRAEVARQRARPEAARFAGLVEQASPARPASAGPAAGGEEGPLVGIVGGGFAGLFAGLILQSLGIECEVFECSDRVGGRIHTWYSTDYQPDGEGAGLYGELGGMRLPQFSQDMLPVQQLALAVNAVLARNGLADKQVFWRKFYYNSKEQRLRYNNMPAPILAAHAQLHSLHFDAEHGGDIPQVWFTKKTDAAGNEYLPVNQVFGQVIGSFVAALSASFAAGFSQLMQYDQYSMWAYLTTVFRLGDLGKYYDPALGAKNELLPWSVASYLETTQVGTNMNAVSFVEMVIAIYDWGGSVDPYRPDITDPFKNVFMLTVDRGMQHFPDACAAVLNLPDAVREQDGHTAQVQVGMALARHAKEYSYSPPNLTPDAQPPQVPAPGPAARVPQPQGGGAQA